MADEFDIDAYLAQPPPGKKPAPVEPPAEPPSAFDVDAYLAQQAPPKVGAWETYFSGSANRLPLGRALVNLLSTGAVQGAKAFGAGRPNVQFTPEAQAQAEALGLPGTSTDSVIPGPLDTYRQIRDTRDARADAGEAQNPWARRASTGTSLLLAMGMPLPKFLGGGTAAGAAREAIKQGTREAYRRAATTGAALGGIQAAGDSRADLTNPGVLPFAQQVVDTGVGGLIGAGGGAFGQGVAQVAAPAIPPLLRGVSQRLTDWGTNMGRRVLLSGADSLSKRLPTSPEAVQEALGSGAILPFGTTKGALQRLENLAEAGGQRYRDIVQGLEARGVPGLAVEPTAEALETAAQREFFRTGANKSTSDILRAEAENLRAVAMGQPNLAPTHGEALKQNLQARSSYNVIDEALENEARRHAASILREADEAAFKKAAEETTDPEIIERVESFIPVKNRLGRILEARGAAERGAQRSAQRGTFNLFDVIIGSSTGDPIQGAAAAMASKLLRARGPSTAASGLYWGGRGVQGLANMASRGNVSGSLPAGISQAASAEERQLMDAWLAQNQDAERALLAGWLTTPPDAQTQSEALRRRRR